MVCLEGSGHLKLSPELFLRTSKCKLTLKVLMSYIYIYDAPHSVGLLGTNDQLVAETST
jgi:hypothetical protein